MARYLRLLFIQLRASVQTALQYRFDFLFEGFTAVFWTATTFVPIFIAYDRREDVAGWTFGESLLVLGFFLLLKSILEGTVNPSLITVVEHIRQGTLDFVLLKPADAQFLVSTAKFDPSAVIGGFGGISLIVAAFIRLQRWPTMGGLLIAALLLVAAIALLYSLWIMVISAAFYVVRVDNLSYLMTSVFDAARWPSSVFRGSLHILFTFVVPLALMTTYPAQALLGHFSSKEAFEALAGAAGFAVIARLIWSGSVARYTSASS